MEGGTPPHDRDEVFAFLGRAKPDRAGARPGTSATARSPTSVNPMTCNDVSVKNRLGAILAKLYEC